MQLLLVVSCWCKVFLLVSRLFNVVFVCKCWYLINRVMLEVWVICLQLVSSLLEMFRVVLVLLCRVRFRLNCGVGVQQCVSSGLVILVGVDFCFSISFSVVLVLLSGFLMQSRLFGCVLVWVSVWLVGILLNMVRVMFSGLCVVLLLIRVRLYCWVMVLRLWVKFCNYLVLVCGKVRVRVKVRGVVFIVVRLLVEIVRVCWVRRKGL